MKRFRRILWRAIAGICAILLLSVISLWIRSQWRASYTEFNTSGQNVRLEANRYENLILRVTDLTPNISATVTGMSVAPSGGIISAGKPMTMRIGPLSAAPTNAQLPNLATAQTAPVNGLTINRRKFQFHGFTWYTGFTTLHPILPGPFPACQVDDFTLNFTTATVLLAVLTLLFGFLGFHRESHFAEGCCQRCGYDLRESPDRCPECGNPTGNAKVAH